jgi:hypothetical protein
MDELRRLDAEKHHMAELMVLRRPTSTGHSDRVEECVVHCCMLVQQSALPDKEKVICELHTELVLNDRPDVQTEMDISPED